jgi:hypothetical protein
VQGGFLLVWSGDNMGNWETGEILKISQNNRNDHDFWENPHFQNPGIIICRKNRTSKKEKRK